MIFINPKTDFAFKKIFGSDQSKDILISFLNGILYSGESVVEDLEILNPYQVPHIRGVKDTYLDVRAKITGDQTVIIEMQVLNVEGFEKRILYNAAKAYSIQLGSGQAYTTLNPVIALTITDFSMFEGHEFISHYVLKEKSYLTDYISSDIELVFVELPKFNKELNELQSLTDKWLFFVKKARELNDIPPIMGEVSEIRHAFEIANQAGLSQAELDDLEHQEFFIQDQMNAILKAQKEGLKQGIEQGKKEQAIAIARQLLDVLDDATITQTTGLSLEEIQNLK
jgi:predicted transposase/invertase (TIGR01784 family)